MNKQTTQSNRPRSLWLERLERRWMLHADVDFFATDHDDHRRDSSGQRSRAFEVGDPLRLQTSDQFQSNHRPRRHEQGRIGDHGVPQMSEPVGMGSRASSPTSVTTILAPPPLTVIVILQPVKNASPPSTNLSQDNAFQRIAPAVTAPIVTAPLVSNSTRGEANENPEARLANIDNALQTVLANDSDNQATETSKLRAEAEDAAESIQDETLVSIQRRESQVGHVEETSDLGDVRLRIKTALELPLTLETERIDHWLSEFSKIKNQLSDLEATLDDLANRQQGHNALDVDKVSPSPQQDQAEFNWRASVSPQTEAKTDEMIWLAAITGTAETPRTVADEPWSESESAQWTMGVGWYRSFEFSDSADSDAVINQSPPIVMAAATTSDLVLDAARLTNKEHPHIPINRSVSYAIVAVSVVSWQVLQRRNRPNVAR